MTYSFDSSSGGVGVDDLIVNKKEVEEEEGKEVNTSPHVKLQGAHRLFKHKTQAGTAEAPFQSLNLKGEGKVLVITP